MEMRKWKQMSVYKTGGTPVYNIMQYSDKECVVFSPTSHYQNRLRYKDYLELLCNYGFEVVKQCIPDGFASNRDIIMQLSLDERFRHYSLSDIAIRIQ